MKPSGHDYELHLGVSDQSQPRCRPTPEEHEVGRMDTPPFAFEPATELAATTIRLAGGSSADRTYSTEPGPRACIGSVAIKFAADFR
jgi:hypothetical protein